MEHHNKVELQDQLQILHEDTYREENVIGLFLDYVHIIPCIVLLNFVYAPNYFSMWVDTLFKVC